MEKRKFKDGKNRTVKMTGFLFDGVPVKRQSGMIYWYSWGKHTFDIRIMRQVLELPKEHPSDNWFMDKEPDATKSFNTLMTQLKDALCGKSFSDAMVDHDKALNDLTDFLSEA